MIGKPEIDPIPPLILTVIEKGRMCNLVNNALDKAGVAYEPFHAPDEAISRLDKNPDFTGFVVAPFGGKYVTVIERAKQLAAERKAVLSFVVITSSTETKRVASVMGAKVVSNNDLKITSTNYKSQVDRNLAEIVWAVTPELNTRRIAQRSLPRRYR